MAHSFLIDMNLTPRWVEYLEIRGHSACQTSSIVRASAPDENIVDLATERGDVVLTADHDFCRIILLSGADSPSIVLLRTVSEVPEDVGELVLNAVELHSTELAAGAFVTVSERGTRVRPLPIIR